MWVWAFCFGVWVRVWEGRGCQVFDAAPQTVKRFEMGHPDSWLVTRVADTEIPGFARNDSGGGMTVVGGMTVAAEWQTAAGELLGFA